MESAAWGRPAAGLCSMPTPAAAQPGQCCPQAGGPSSLVSLLRSPQPSLLGLPRGASATCGGTGEAPHRTSQPPGVFVSPFLAGLSFVSVCFLCRTRLAVLCFPGPELAQMSRFCIHGHVAHAHTHPQAPAAESPARAPSPVGECFASRAAFCTAHLQTLQSPRISSLMRKRSMVLTIKTRLKVYI